MICHQRQNSSNLYPHTAKSGNYLISMKQDNYPIQWVMSDKRLFLLGEIIQEVIRHFLKFYLDFSFGFKVFCFSVGLLLPPPQVQLWKCLFHLVSRLRITCFKFKSINVRNTVKPRIKKVQRGIYHCYYAFIRIQSDKNERCKEI